MLYVRYSNSEPEKIIIDFDYIYKSQTKLHYSFNRSKYERLSDFLHRLKIKINLDIEKRLKKQKLKSLNSAELMESFVTEATVINEEVTCSSNLYDMPLEKTLLDKSILLINDNKYFIIVNAPIINSIKLSKYIFEGCPTLPIVSMDFGEIRDLNYEWFITSNKKSWQLVHTGFTFIPNCDYIKKFLKLRCTCSKTSQFVETISKDVILKSPDQKAIETRLQYTKSYTPKMNRFRIMSYNLLANIYSSSSTARDKLFRHCPYEYLNMDYRLGLLVKEIFYYHSDIICLQEVDSSIFKTILSPFFSINGFDGLFQAKDNQSMEGQAILWRKSKFTLIKDLTVKSISKLVLDDELIHFTQIRNLIRNSPIILDQWIQLKQCMVGCIIQSVDDIRNKLIIINTHLYFRPNAEVYRFLQISAILTNIEMALKDYPDAKTILAGDFNDSRNSNTINLILNRSVEISNIFSNDKLGISLSHNLLLESACNAVFTNYILDFANEIDYIFYDVKGLVCKTTVPFPSEEDIKVGIALPNKDFPSDHLALIADFQFKL